MRRAWEPPRVPHWLWSFVMRGAWVVGSQARRYAEGLEPLEGGDWDVVVPHATWHEAARFVPLSARPNGFRGWRFTAGGVEYDVWPDDVVRVLAQALTEPDAKGRGVREVAHAVDLLRGIVIQGRRP